VSNAARYSAGATSFSAAGFFSFAFAAALVAAGPRPRPAGGFAGGAVAGLPRCAGAGVPLCAADIVGIVKTAARAIIVVN
jgi:hypothetical protein